MSNVKAAIKVADQLITRVFDQRQFTTGEINCFVREFEDQSNLEENLSKILKINQNVSIVSDSYTSDMCKSGDQTAKDICDQVVALHQRAERLLNLEETHRQNEERLLAEQRREREELRQTSLRNCTVRLENTIDGLMKEELELERKYLKFEENLRNNK